MDTRDILNSLGEKIGELSLPEDTTEETWVEKLSIYAAPIAPVLEPISPRQLRLALFMTAGITDEFIESLIDTLPSPTKQLALIEWRYAISFERSRHLVDEVRSILGWSKEQLDQLWLFAATL